MRKEQVAIAFALLMMGSAQAFGQVSFRGGDAWGTFPQVHDGRAVKAPAQYVAIGQDDPAEIAAALACPQRASVGWAYQPGYTGVMSADLGRSDGYKTRGFNSFDDNFYNITGLRIYGFFLNVGQGFAPCDDRWTIDDEGNATVPLTFDIQFFTSDANGMPYKYYLTETHTAIGHSTTVETSFGTVYYFDIDLDDPVLLQKGWFSVALADDGSGAACSFFLYGHAGVGSQGLIMINESEFWSSEAATYCLLTDGTVLPGVTPPDPEPEPDPEPDDGQLPVPKPLAATEVTPDGFAANWEPCKKRVNGYEVFVYATKYITEDNTDFHYFTTDFSNIEIGTIDKPESGVFYGDLPDADRYGWTVYNSVSAEGALGLDNSMYGILNGSMMSPIMDLSQGNGEVTVTMNVCGRNVTAVNLYLFEDNREISAASMPVTTEWAERSVTLTGGTKNSYLLVEVDKNSPGYLFISDFDMFQQLPAGSLPLSPYSYDYTLDPNASSLYMETLKPLYENEELAYRLTSFYDSQRSQFSDPVFVIPHADGMTIVESGIVAPLRFDLIGRRIGDNSTPSIYIKNGRCYRK